MRPRKSIYEMHTEGNDANRILHLLESLSSSACVERDDVIETYDFEERLGVHPLRRRPVCPSLLQRAHRGADAVHGGNA